MAPLQLAFALATGWISYPLRVMPAVRVGGPVVALGLICLALFTAGAHAFLRWLYGEVRGGRWRARWTAGLIALVVLMFASGIAATGVTHQVGWLLRADEPLVDSNVLQYEDRSASFDNLKRLGTGLSNYQDLSGSLPAGGTFDPHGRMLHGWQAALLPFIEQPALYDAINFGLPWDHPANNPPFRTRVDAYLNPGIRDRAAPDEYAPSHYAGNARLLGGDVPRSLKAIPDGAATTILAGEIVGAFRPWGDPANWRDPAEGINATPLGFGSPYPGTATFLFADGSVRVLEDTIDPRILRALSTPAGGEPIRDGDY